MWRKIKMVIVFTAFTIALLGFIGLNVALGQGYIEPGSFYDHLVVVSATMIFGGLFGGLIVVLIGNE